MTSAEKAKGPAADRTPRIATATNQANDNAPGFWRRASMGKVRAGAREPQITHYGCSRCRWSA